MFERTTPIRDPVTVHVDGRAVEAERGEPLAVALLAAGETTLARSPKLHRPRGPSCLRGECDGCLARVDGVPNVMTCLRDVRGGDEVVGQNVLGTRRVDLMRVTDWFFPNGIDHHHLMAGIPGVQDVMQTFARQMAGIGRLPDAAAPPARAARLACDVLIVGSGLAGLSCAAALVRGGRTVHVVDDAPAPGGSAVYAGADAASPVAAELGAIPEGRVALRTTCAGFYDGEALLVGRAGAQLARARAVVVASGAHDGVLIVPGNDLPGVMSARALCALAARGVVPTGGVLIVGRGAWSERAARALGPRVLRVVDEQDVIAISGRGRAKGVRLADHTRLDVGLVAVAIPGAPSFELAEQLGAHTRLGAGGYAVVTDERGRAAERLWAVGECAGLPFDPAALIDAGRRAAADILAQPSTTSSKSESPPTTKTNPKRPSSEK